MDKGAAQEETTIRVDRWFWFARFFKSRSTAAKVVQSRKVRLNSVIIAKPSVNITQNDVLTFPQGEDIRVIKVLKTGNRRGPALEAQMLYEDLAPKVDTPQETSIKNTGTAFEREPGAGRPTKAERRALDKFKQSHDT